MACCISEESTVLESIKINAVTEKNFTEMENWKPSEYWKRIIYIVRIPAKYQNCDIMTASQCFVGAVKAVRCDMDIYNRYYRTMTSRNGHSRHSDCVHTLELIQQLRNKVLDSIQMVRQSC